MGAQKKKKKSKLAFFSIVVFLFTDPRYAIERRNIVESTS